MEKEMEKRRVRQEMTVRRRVNEAMRCMESKRTHVYRCDSFN